MAAVASLCCAAPLGNRRPVISTTRSTQMDTVLRLLIDRIGTPIGEMLIVADNNGNLRATDWTDHGARLHLLLQPQYGKKRSPLEPACNPNGLTDAIARYFAGELTAIDTLPV